MTMVNTFMKTQHQHVMPQRKERKMLKANTWADPGRHPLSSRIRARGQGEGRPALPTAQHTPPRPAPLQCHSNSTGSPPQQPPAPGKRPDTTGKTMECVRMLAGGPLKEPTPLPPKSHASFIPVAYSHLGRQTCSQKVGNRDDKTWLENDQRVRPRTRTDCSARAAVLGRNAAHGQHGIIIYSKNGHAPRLNLYFSRLSFTVE